MDDFSKQPVSLAEARAEKAQDGTLWTLRDALVSLLREIDSGKVDPGAGIIVYANRVDGGSRTCFTAAGGAGVQLLGLLSRASYMINDSTR